MKERGFSGYRREYRSLGGRECLGAGNWNSWGVVGSCDKTQLRVCRELRGSERGRAIKASSRYEVGWFGLWRGWVA